MNNHPLAMSHHNQLGFLDDLEDWGQSMIDDFNKDYIDPTLESVGLSKEQADQLKRDAEVALKKEIEAEKDKLASDLMNQITDGGGMQSKTPKTGNVVTDTVNQIKDNSIVKATPGGIYTIAGAGLVITALLLRGR